MEKAFSKLEQLAWGGLLVSFSRLNRQIELDLLEHSQITHVEYEVLLRLYYHPQHRLRLQELAEISLLSQSGTSRVVERLEKAGLVNRITAVEDRRGAYAVLSEKGFIKFENACEKHTTFVKLHFLDHFSKTELLEMAGFWRVLDEKENPGK